MTGTRRQRDIRRSLRGLAPLIPFSDAEAVATRAVGGSLRTLPPSIAAWLALTSHIRHRYTEYDALLAEGYERDAARFFVAGSTDDVLSEWGCARSVSDEGEESDAMEGYALEAEMPALHS